MAIKPDMSKTYNCVEWEFLQKMMFCMGFATEWINLIMKCVMSVSYLVLINGRIGERFCPSRGLRQGNPLRPFLFLICKEGLLTLIKLAIQKETLKRV